LAPRPPLVFLLTALLCLVWGSTWVVIQGGLASLPPFSSAAIRFALSAACMSALAATFGAREGGQRPGWRLALALGTLNFAGSYGIVYWSETRLPSGLVSVLWAVFPMLQATLGHFCLPGERLGAWQLGGFVLGFLGVASLFATDLRGLGAGAVPAGALVLVAPLVSAFGTTAVKRFGAGTSSLALNRDAMWIGAACLGALALALERDASFTWDRGAFLSLAYLALCGTVLTFGIYFWLLRHVAASQLSVIAYVTPAIALALGALVNDEPLTRHTLLGFAGIVAGVFLVHHGARRRQRATLTASSAARPERPAT